MLLAAPCGRRPLVPFYAESGKAEKKPGMAAHVVVELTGKVSAAGTPADLPSIALTD